MGKRPVPALPPVRPRVAPPTGVLPRPVIPVITRFPNPVAKHGARR